MNDLDQYFISFETKADDMDASDDELVFLNIWNHNEEVIETIMIPWMTYDDILACINHNFINAKDYAFISIDIPISSTLYQYHISMMNKDHYLIIRKYHLVNKKLIHEYFIQYDNIE
ncbi:MAG: hypothetical protein PHC62_00775 [Candidatus Izemoplasmatales bacterium]|nr:hypothetical protein [Candidatus Izemoplasmatales bacterium]